MSNTRCALGCKAFGVPFRLAAESEELLQALRERAPWGTTVFEELRERRREFALWRNGAAYCVTADGELLGKREELRLALDDLAREVMVHVAEYAPEHVFVHAGVVSWDGHGLVLPGASFAGKTTLVAELVRAGAAYYSDEYAVLDADGYVHPYARPLGMRAPGAEQQTAIEVGALGGVAGDAPVRASLVAFLEYAHGAQWRREPVSPGMAALEMLRHAVPVRRTPQRVMASLGKMMEGAQAMRSARGEAKETAQILLALMERES